MSFMTMNMFAPLTWGFDRSDMEMRIAREAGWSRSDLVWERLMEAGNAAAQEANGLERAQRLFRSADWLARFRFAGNDPRRATTAANRAILAFRIGSQQDAEKFQRRALDVWRDASAAVDAMQILPRSRSSLFHLRMEALHRDTFHDNMRTRINAIVGETRETLSRLSSDGPAPHRHFSRWRGERPTVFDDTRKVLGACLLILDH